MGGGEGLNNISLCGQRKMELPTDALLAFTLTMISSYRLISSDSSPLFSLLSLFSLVHTVILNSTMRTFLHLKRLNDCS